MTDRYCTAFKIPFMNRYIVLDEWTISTKPAPTIPNEFPMGITPNEAFGVQKEIPMDLVQDDLVQDDLVQGNHD